jgi:hypothetical protein
MGTLVRPRMGSWISVHTDLGSLEVSSVFLWPQTQQCWHSWRQAGLMLILTPSCCGLTQGLRVPRTHGCWEHVAWMTQWDSRLLWQVEKYVFPWFLCLELLTLHMVSLMLSCGLVEDVHLHLIFLQSWVWMRGLQTMIHLISASWAPKITVVQLI